MRRRADLTKTIGLYHYIMGGDLIIQFLRTFNTYNAEIFLCKFEILIKVLVRFFHFIRIKML